MTEDRFNGLSIRLIHRGTGFLLTPTEIYIAMTRSEVKLEKNLGQSNRLIFETLYSDTEDWNFSSSSFKPLSLLKQTKAFKTFLKTPIQSV